MATIRRSLEECWMTSLLNWKGGKGPKMARDAAAGGVPYWFNAETCRPEEIKFSKVSQHGCQESQRVRRSTFLAGDRDPSGLPLLATFYAGKVRRIASIRAHAHLSCKSPLTPFRIVFIFCRASAGGGVLPSPSSI
jgi:hypothetical protein